jgi:hypothetical protein
MHVQWQHLCNAQITKLGLLQFKHKHPGSGGGSLHGSRKAHASHEFARESRGMCEVGIENPKCGGTLKMNQHYNFT